MGDPLRGQMTGVNMGYDGPPSFLQRGDQAARGFLRMAAALRGPDHDPGDLSRARLRTTRRQRRLDRPNRRPPRRSCAPALSSCPTAGHRRVSGAPPAVQSGRPALPRTTARRR